MSEMVANRKTCNHLIHSLLSKFLGRCHFYMNGGGLGPEKWANSTIPDQTAEVRGKEVGLG